MKDDYLNDENDDYKDMANSSDDKEADEFDKKMYNF